MSIATKTSPKIIDLNKILNANDAIEIKRMQTEFETNGWCFVILPNELIPNPTLTDGLGQFFSQTNGKDSYSQRSRIYGYSRVNHKEGLKLLTGSQFSKLAHRGLVPRELVDPLNFLSQVFDAVSKRLIELLDQHSVFQQQPSLTTLVERADLPMKEEHFGMLDIVSYFNKRSGFKPPKDGQTTKEVNCVPHYDPGLLSISILSTHEGLQLKDMITDEWIDGSLEPNIGVIWLGEAASQLTENRLKPGIHRVVYPQKGNTRLTMWYEVCTIEQLRNLRAERQNEVMAAGTVTFPNLPGSAPIAVQPGETKLDFLRRVEMGRGLSMSKSGRVHYDIQEHAISYPMNPSESK